VREERLRISDAAGEPKPYQGTGHREADMSEEPLPPLRFFVHDIKPESTKISYLIEVEIETKHYMPPPLKPRTKSVRYIGAMNPLVAYHVDADLETRAYCNGELTHKATEVEGDIDMVERERKAALDYLTRHLSEELKRVTANLCEEAYLHISSPAEREQLIKQKVRQDETAIRKRLPPAPNKMTPEERDRFFDLALDAVAGMRKEKLDYTRTNLAETMYPENSNPLQVLRRQVKRAGFHNPRRKGDFDDILWILADMYSQMIRKKAFRVEGNHELRWDE
jgi:hypothetical protein